MVDTFDGRCQRGTARFNVKMAHTQYYHCGFPFDTLASWTTGITLIFSCTSWDRTLKTTCWLWSTIQETSPIACKDETHLTVADIRVESGL